MAKHIYYCLAFLLSFQALSAQQKAQVQEVEIDSRELGQTRKVSVYTPIGYNERPYQLYQVIYVFDAQSREFVDLVSSLASFMTQASYKFIVVGVQSTYIKEESYARNNDFLPPAEHEASKSEWGGISRNADNFMGFLKKELIPYMDENYRTMSNRTAIGHSLGASFLIYAMTQNPDIFYNYINVSPNLAFDQEKLRKDLTQFDFNRLQPNSLFYLSSANEGESFGENWLKARVKTHAYLKDSLGPIKRAILVEEFPEESHWSTVARSFLSALSTYFKAIQPGQLPKLSEQEEEITFRVKVPASDDELYITGNQESLGNWDPGKVKMKKVSAFEREITLKVKSPLEFKFTKGSWETEAHLLQEQWYGANLMLKPEGGKTYELEVCRYKGEDWGACMVD